MSSHFRPDGVTAQPAEFSKTTGSDPVMHEGHQAGRPAAPTDAVPEFHGKTLPPGSAPPDSTFAPQSGDLPSQAANPDTAEDAQTSAADTLGGASSADVHRGYGMPAAQGQTSAELHHAGQRPGKRERYGLMGRSPAYPEQGAVDPRGDESQRALQKDEAVQGRGDKGAKGAEDIPPTSA